MLKKKIIFITIFLIFLTTLSSHAALYPDIQSALQSLGPDDEIQVIITLSDKADIKGLKKEFKDRRSMRSRLINALKSKADATQGPVRSFLETARAKKIKQFWIMNGIAATVPAERVEQIARFPGIEAVTLDAVIHAPEPVYAAEALGEWNLEKVKVTDLWDYGITGQGTIVANMDTGVDYLHSDLQERWRGGTNSWFSPYSLPENADFCRTPGACTFCELSSSPCDVDGHGTGTMGVMVGGDAGGTVIGVAPEAKWIAVKIFNDEGDAFLSAIVDGFQWLLDPDNNPDTDDAPDVVNNSWAYDAPNRCINSGAYAVLKTTIQNLKEVGIAVVFSAGNSGPYASTSVSPANYPDSFSVGATNIDDLIADFSSRGPSACDGSIFPNVVAPGKGIKIAYPPFGPLYPYAYANGTSFSAPHVAGAMALLRSAFPDISVSKMELALRRSAADLGPEGQDNVYGYGRLDVSAAYSLLLEHGVTNPYLEVVKTGKGEGTVVSDIGSILCGADCFDSYNPGTVVTLSASPAEGSYFGGWSGCPSANGNQCVVSVNDDTTVSAKFWGNSIQVMKPVKGDVVSSGSRMTLKWVAPSNANHFTVKYSPDNGATWSILAQNVADVKYLWSVPKPLENIKNNLLKVIGYTKTGVKVGSAVSAPFIIEVVKMTSPNGWENLISRNFFDITWAINDTKRPVAKVILEYTKNSGQTWIVIDRLTGDRLTEFDGSYPWTVPDVKEPKEKCKVRVRLKDSAGNEIGRDASDNYFTINPSYIPPLEKGDEGGFLE